MKTKTHILLVEDEPFLGKVVMESLEKQGYSVTWFEDGKLAWSNFSVAKFDVCVLDVMLPGIDGFSLAQKIRLSEKELPILFLTARNAIEDVKTGYASGGNDYLRKPFSLDELFLRIEQLVNRGKSPVVSDEIPVGTLKFNMKRQELLQPDGKVVKLSHRETGLLEILLKNKNEITDRKQALLELWGDDSFFHARSMDVYVTRLRKILSVDASISIINIRGFGYKLIDSE
ncbi:MAG: response regulator transcription factor [Flavobacterium sp.]|uniref:response regulator transcription factor n=1 Tax=Flavobacterium sp. TaxID=239 RepID=UPI0011F50B0A|nr:response regulator transcription factor [Flavobacterium sp.]RZJ64348.1 MAG: response regulator transcription factor [Flavobacterium sp.]